LCAVDQPALRAFADQQHMAQILRPIALPGVLLINERASLHVRNAPSLT
jgi:hypothetical protein